MEERLNTPAIRNAKRNLSLVFILHLKSLLILLNENDDYFQDEKFVSDTNLSVTNIKAYIHYIVGYYNRGTLESEQDKVSSCLFYIEKYILAIQSHLSLLYSSSPSSEAENLTRLFFNELLDQIRDYVIEKKAELDVEKLNVSIKPVLIEQIKTTFECTKKIHPTPSQINDIMHQILKYPHKGSDHPITDNLLIGRSLKKSLDHFYSNGSVSELPSDLKLSKFYLSALYALIPYQLETDLYIKIIHALPMSRHCHYQKLATELQRLIKCQNKNKFLLEKEIQIGANYYRLREFFSTPIMASKNLIHLICEYIIQIKTKSLWADKNLRANIAFSLFALGFLLNYRYDPLMENPSGQAELIFQIFFDFMQNLLQYYKKAEHGDLWLRLRSICHDPDINSANARYEDGVHLAILKSVLDIFEYFIAWPALQSAALDPLNLSELLREEPCRTTNKTKTGFTETHAYPDTSQPAPAQSFSTQMGFFCSSSLPNHDCGIPPKKVNAA